MNASFEKLDQHSKVPLRGVAFKPVTNRRAEAAIDELSVLDELANEVVDPEDKDVRGHRAVPGDPTRRCP